MLCSSDTVSIEACSFQEHRELQMFEMLHLKEKYMTSLSSLIADHILRGKNDKEIKV